nr:hypothetical protein BaRGS_034352 [Batillaria attramentaria]
MLTKRINRRSCSAWCLATSSRARSWRDLYRRYRVQAAAVRPHLSPGTLRRPHSQPRRPQLRLRSVLITVLGLYMAVQWVAFSALLLFACTRFMEETHFPVVSYVVLVFLVCFAAFSLPLDFGMTVPDKPDPVRTPADGVWETALVVFMVYALMPLRTLVAVVLGVLLPLMHLAVSAFVANTFPSLLWRQPV